MKNFKTVDEYILNAPKGREILIVLREIINTTELVETIKWGIPVYTFNNKNVVGLGAFKSYTGIWFYQGVFLKDDTKVLINASEDKTKGLRQWRFTSADEIDDKLVLKYLNEAIRNQKLGKEITPDRNKQIRIPGELIEVFKDDKELENRFNQLTPGRKRKFADYVSSAKQIKTRKARVQKIIPLILAYIGLNDKYRK